jgi:hypothetical protein
LNEKPNFEAFKYFLECYFNVSANYDELEQLIEEFNISEGEKYRKQLKMELELILQQGNWDAVKEFVRKHGMRNMSHDKLKWVVNNILIGIKVI